MIKFYIERQPDDLLKATFTIGDVPVGIKENIAVASIDAVIGDFYPDQDKEQIFESLV